MPCCKCCCGNQTCTEGQQGKCCCGGTGGTCCQAGQYCCNGACQNTPCGCPGNIEILYQWGAGQTDLDTATTFLGDVVGYGCAGGNPYLTFTSGDVTGSSGEEKVTVDAAGAIFYWNQGPSVDIGLYAGWYQGSSSGSITIKARCAGNAASEQTLTVTPGNTHPCSTSPPSHRVATVTVYTSNSFTLSPLP